MTADFRQLQRQLGAHLRDPDSQAYPGIEDRRLNIYRELFYNNIESFLRRGFPVLHDILSADDRWHRLVRRFFASHHCTTPHFVEIPREFVDFLAHTAIPDYPPFTAELAHYEWLELALDVAGQDFPAQFDPEGDLLTGCPVLNPISALVQYHWPVHQLSRQYQPDRPLDTAMTLLLFRNRDDRVRFMEINTPTRQLIEAIKARPTLSGAMHLQHLADALGLPTAQVLAFGGELLQQLRRQQYVLGTTPASGDTS